MSYMNTNQSPVTNGTPVVNSVPSATPVKLLVYRNKLTGQMVPNDEGKQIAEWDRDKDGNIIQDPVEPAKAQLHDNVVIKGWYHLAMQNPAEALAKLDKAHANLPSGLRIAPAKGANIDFSLSNALGRPIKVKISANGSYLGWVAEESGSPSNPHAVTL